MDAGYFQLYINEVTRPVVNTKFFTIMVDKGFLLYYVFKTSGVSKYKVHQLSIFKSPKHVDTLVDSINSHYNKHIGKDTSYVELLCTRYIQGDGLYENTNSAFKNTGFSKIVLNESCKRKIIEQLDRFKNDRDFYKEHGLNHKLIVLIHGEPGVGKTTLIKSIAGYLNRHVVQFDLAKNNIALLEQIDDNNVIVIEDCDTHGVLKDRKEKYSNKDKIATIYREINSEFSDKNNQGTNTKKELQKTNKSLSEILQLFDGLNNLDNMVVILTTNHKEVLDHALVRPGRIDLDIYMEPFTNKEVIEYYTTHYGNDAPRFVIPRKYKDLTIIGGIMKIILLESGRNPKDFIKNTIEYYENCYVKEYGESTALIVQ